MIIVSPTLCRLFSVIVKVNGITLWPFILVSGPPTPVTVNHESVHLRQQLELLVVFFYVIYVGEWLWYVTHGASSEQAYERLRFEREAYAHEEDPTYLEKRKFLAWREIPLYPAA